jgi:hypothetical protein
VTHVETACIEIQGDVTARLLVGGLRRGSDSENRDETVRARTARLVSADQTGGRYRFLREPVASTTFQSRRHRLLARVAASNRGKTGCRAIAATGRNDRGQRLVAFPPVVGGTPYVA